MCDCFYLERFCKLDTQPLVERAWSEHGIAIRPCIVPIDLDYMEPVRCWSLAVPHLCLN